MRLSLCSGACGCAHPGRRGAGRAVEVAGGGIGTRSLQGTTDAAAPRWSPAAHGVRARAAWSRYPHPPPPPPARRLNRDRMCAVRLASRPLVQLARHHGFRCLGLCAFFHSIGMVGEQVVLGWYILELTDSAFMVGLALGVRNLPLLFAGIPAGVVADRGDRVRLLRISGVTMAVAAALLGALVAAGLGGVGPALMLTFFTGCARALHQTARQGYAHDIAGGRSVVHALALVALTSRLGGLLGSLMTGFLIARFGSAASLVALGFAPSFPVVLLVLVAANALGAVTDVLAQTLIQLAVPSGLRGRAGGAWVVSIGMAPLGQFQVGALASLFGVGAALGVNGLALMAVGAAAALLVPRLRRL